MDQSTSMLVPLMRLIGLAAVVSWFASAFHLTRLFNAHRAALRLWEPERGLLHDRFTRMERRALFGVAWPAFLVMALFGLGQLWMSPSVLKLPFMHLRLGIVALLVAHQLIMHRVHAKLRTGELAWSGPLLWLFGQGAWALMAALLATFTFRDQLGWAWGALGLLVLGVVAGFAIMKARGAKADAPRNEAPPDQGLR